MTITIEIDAQVAQALEAALAAQAGIGPSTVDDWLRTVLEQNIANVTMPRLRLQAVDDARAQVEAAQRALIRAAAGITRLHIER